MVTSYVGRNCLLKDVAEVNVEGRLEVTGRRGTKRKQQLDDLTETTEYWKLKKGCTSSDSVDNSLSKGYRPVIRQNYGMNEYGMITSKN